LLAWTPTVDGRQIEQDHQSPGAFDVAEKSMAQAPPFAGALDQARDVGDHELVLVKADYTQVRFEGREGVIGDFGLGRGDPRDEGAFPGVRKAHQGHIGHQLELQVQPALLPALGLLRERRGPPAIGEEPGIASAALPASGRLPAGALGDQVRDDLAAGISDDRSLGNGHLQVGSGLAVAALAHPVRPVVGPTVGMVSKAVEGRDVAVGHQPDAAAVTPIAAVGTTLGDVRFPAKRDRTRSTITCFDMDLGFVDERGHLDP
jgi:hypothetical protein